MGFEGVTTNELKTRLWILSETIKDAQRNNDDRWKRLVPQQREINQELSRRSKASGTEPPPSMVRMKPAHMKARRKSLQGVVCGCNRVLIMVGNKVVKVINFIKGKEA